MNLKVEDEKTSENPEQRSIKDLEEDVDIGSMAAELSGDPIFKEKASLQKRVGEAHTTQQVFSICNRKYTGKNKTVQNGNKPLL